MKSTGDMSLGTGRSTGSLTLGSQRSSGNLSLGSGRSVSALNTSLTYTPPVPETPAAMAFGYAAVLFGAAGYGS